MDTSKLKRAIENRDVSAIVELFFERPVFHLRDGLKREDPLWDYKETCPEANVKHAEEWSRIAVDVMAFHNAEGGVIIFGVSDNYELHALKHKIDSKLFNDQIRKYVGDTLWVPFNREICHGGYVGVAVVQPRGLTVLRALQDAPLGVTGRRQFFAGDIPVREGDQTKTYRGGEAERYLRENSIPTSSALYLVDEADCRILRPEYERFVRRNKIERELWRAIDDPRCYVTHLTGFGGVGKTALALWFALQLYEKRRFEFIMSASARDRALSATGITEVRATLTSYDELLSDIASILGFAKDFENASLEQKESGVLVLLADTKTLLILDNLETVDDERILEFVERLPYPVRAIVTARRQRVQKSVYPIVVGGLELDEALSLIGHLIEGRGREHLAALSLKERELIADRCLYVPLAIEWVVARASTPSEALDFSGHLEKYHPNTDELLEFCFRRLHEGLSREEQAVLSSMAVFNSPQPAEALAEAAAVSLTRCEDVLETLKLSHLVLERQGESSPGVRVYDANTLVKRFCYAVLSEQPGREQEIRKRLSSWYDGLDIENRMERQRVSEMRKGLRDPEAIYLELGIQCRRQGQYPNAERYLKLALERKPSSWRAYRELGELYREQEHLRTALQMYEGAARYSPKKGPDRALIYREWGMLLRKSGMPDANEQALEKLEIAFVELPNDRVCAVALAQVCQKMGHWNRIKLLLEPLVGHEDPETRKRVRPLLLNAFDATGDIVKAADLRNKMKQP